MNQPTPATADLVDDRVVVPAYRDDETDTLYIWCEHELTWHTHGGCGGVVGGGNGSRVSHCGCPQSPWYGATYVLREDGPLDWDLHLQRKDEADDAGGGCIGGLWCRVHGELLHDGSPDPDQPEAGSRLLDELHAKLTRYVIFPTTEAADAVTLYVAATHGQPAWEHATRLVIKSPIKRCGKTRLQEVIAETCHRPIRTANCSTAALVRSIGHDQTPTLILDEADTVFGGKKASRDGVAEDLRGILNAGHSRGWPYLRWNPNGKDGGELEESPTFAMAVIGGIGDLPDTIEDRGVIVSMRRRGNGETVAPFRRRAIPELHDLRDRLHLWVRIHLDLLEVAEPVMPVEDRAADVWEPLMIIAALAGGQWPDRARSACLALTADQGSDPDTAQERLLTDLYRVWGDEEHLFTTTILERLHKLDEAPWGDWYGKPLSSRGLAKLLKPWGIKSSTVRTAAGTAKGYSRAAMTDAWGRYVTAVEGVSVTSVTTSHDDENPGLTSENGCDGFVTDSVDGNVTTPGCCEGGAVKLSCQLCAKSPTHYGGDPA